MDSNAQHHLNKAQNLATSAHIFAVIALIVIGLSILFEAGIPIVRLIREHDLTWAQRFSESGLLLVAILPAVLLLESIKSLRHALQSYGTGEFFSHEASKRVTEAGDYAVQAMIAFMLIVPNLTLWINHSGGFDIRIESEFIGMLAFAIFIAAVGRVLSAATSMKQENDSFI